YPMADVLFLNGAAGDINHHDAINPGRTSGGYEYSNKVGKILAAEVIKVLQRRSLCAVSMDIKVMNKVLVVDHRRVSEKERDEAYEIIKTFHSGEKLFASGEGSAEIKGMDAVGAIAKAYQTFGLAEEPDTLEMEVQVIS